MLVETGVPLVVLDGEGRPCGLVGEKAVLDALAGNVTARGRTGEPSARAPERSAGGDHGVSEIRALPA